MITTTFKNTGAINKNRKNADPRIRQENKNNEIPHNVASNILHYDSNSQISEDEPKNSKMTGSTISLTPLTVFSSLKPLLTGSDTSKK